MLTVGHDLMMKREEDVGANHPPITSIMNCSDSLQQLSTWLFLETCAHSRLGFHSAAVSMAKWIMITAHASSVAPSPSPDFFKL